MHRKARIHVMISNKLRSTWRSKDILIQHQRCFLGLQLHCTCTGVPQTSSSTCNHLAPAIYVISMEILTWKTYESTT